MKYQLISFKTCPWVQRAAIVLREKKCEFEFTHISHDNRADWSLKISPHKKVPVLRIDDKISLFESNAITEYLDETIAPCLAPEGPVQRAINRAWTDYIPTFASQVTGAAYAKTEDDYLAVIAKIDEPFGRLEGALEKQGAGPYFNGAKFALVDAGYAPFLQRHLYLDEIKKIGKLEKYPRLMAWAQALLARPSTHTFAPAEFAKMYREKIRSRSVYLSQFIEANGPAAE